MIELILLAGKPLIKQVGGCPLVCPGREQGQAALSMRRPLCPGAYRSVHSLLHVFMEPGPVLSTLLVLAVLPAPLAMFLTPPLKLVLLAPAIFVLA